MLLKGHHLEAIARLCGKAANDPPYRANHAIDDNSNAEAECKTVEQGGQKPRDITKLWRNDISTHYVAP